MKNLTNFSDNELETFRKKYEKQATLDDPSIKKKALSYLEALGDEIAKRETTQKENNKTKIDLNSGDSAKMRALKELVSQKKDINALNRSGRIEVSESLPKSSKSKPKRK